MSQEVFKAPKAKRPNPKKDSEPWSPTRKRKAKNDFLGFCDVVLAYTGYDHVKHEDIRAQNNTSPLDSGGSTAESFTSDSTSSAYTTEEELFLLNAGGHTLSPRVAMSNKMGKKDIATDDSLDSITCFCLKPFAGRPMIECSQCLIWIHLSCAKIRRNNIPEEFICQRCRESKINKRKSTRIRTEKGSRRKNNFRSSATMAASSSSLASPPYSVSPPSSSSSSPSQSSVPVLTSASPPLPPSPPSSPTYFPL